LRVLEGDTMTDFSVIANYTILSDTYFGNTLLQYIFALLILLGTAIAAKIIYFIIKKFIHSIAAKTETDLDDLLLKALEKPIVFFIIVLGLSISVTPLTLEKDLLATFNNLIGVLITLNVAWLVVALIEVGVDKFIVPFTKESRSKLDDQLVPIFKNGLKSIVFILAILTVISNFGYDVTAVLGGLGIAGLAIAMAAKDSLSNLLGSATIFTDRPFEVEDAVNIGSHGGSVEEVGMRSTRLRTWNGTLLTLPNAVVANSAIENYSKSSRRRIRIKLGLEYGTSSKKIEKAKDHLKEIVNKTRGVDPDNCSVHFAEFGESAIQLMLTYYILETSRYWDIQDEVNTQIKQRFEKSGIEFAFPSRALYVKD
jgi:MscS family membrane protein